MQKKYFTLFIFLITIIFTNKAFASSLYIIPTPGGQAGIISYDVMIDTQGSNINAISGKISILKDVISSQSISTIDSVVVNWLVPPEVVNKIIQGDREIISFEGMIPGGFKGILSPYFKNLKAGKLFTIILKANKIGKADIVLEDIVVLLNDGLGSNDKVTLAAPLVFSVSDEQIKYKEILNKNKIEINTDTMTTFIDKNEIIANDKWFISFQEDTTRKDVDHYDVAESYDGDPRNVFFFNWHTQTSPTILSDQDRKHFIHIKTFYKDGSFSYTTLQPVDKTKTFYFIYIILTLSGMLVLYLLKNYDKKKFIKIFKRK